VDRFRDQWQALVNTAMNLDPIKGAACLEELKVTASFLGRTVLLAVVIGYRKI
jgi:hypothetical protein